MPEGQVALSLAELRRVAARELAGEPAWRMRCEAERPVTVPELFAALAGVPGEVVARKDGLWMGARAQGWVAVVTELVQREVENWKNQGLPDPECEWRATITTVGQDPALAISLGARESAATPRFVVPTIFSVEVRFATRDVEPLPLWRRTAQALARVGVELDADTLVTGPRAVPSPDVEALHVAARSGDVAAIDAILDRGIAVDAPDLQGRSALWIALHAGQEAAAAALAQRGARLTGGRDGESALYHALANRQFAAARAMLPRGIDAALEQAKPSWLLAVETGAPVSLLDALVEAGSPFGAWRHGDDARVLARRAGREDILEWLRGRKART